MKTGEWTGGPWAVSKQKARRVTASGVVICNAVLRNQGGPKHKAYLKDEHEAEANGNLIAAAPELFEALELIVRRADAVQEISGGTLQHSDLLVATIAARTALNKALGK